MFWFKCLIAQFGYSLIILTSCKEVSNITNSREKFFTALITGDIEFPIRVVFEMPAILESRKIIRKSLFVQSSSRVVF